MATQSFRVKLSTLAILEIAGQRVAVRVGTGDVVTLLNGPLDGIRLVDVYWNGKTAQMFTIDLRERADLIQSEVIAAIHQIPGTLPPVA